VRFAALPSLVAFAAIAAAGVASCSFGTGVNQPISGSLNVPDCWSGPYDLKPDFYAAVPYLHTLELRIQNGGDYETFSDGIEILIDDTTKIIPNEYGKPLTVGLPVGVTPPGVPITPNPNPPLVHLALYLQATCQIQDVALYALDSVTLNAAGNCDPSDGGAPVLVCPGSTSGLASASPDGGVAGGDAGGVAAEGGSGEAGVSVSDGGLSEAGAAQPVGHSTITFNALFDGDETAVSAAERKNDGSMSVYLADPREVCPGGVGPPPPCRGYLHGNFTFYFQRGRPAQPFP
jgi:hypothetical protein